MRVNREIEIDEKWLQESFIRSSGPGGQNVNKVATAVQLRFDLYGCDCLSEEVKGKLRRLAGKKITARGEVVIDARTFRTREKNRIAARDRLRKMILRALKTKKIRIDTVPSKAAREKRIQQKKMRKSVKESRRRILRSDDNW